MCIFVEITNNIRIDIAKALYGCGNLRDSIASSLFDHTKKLGDQIEQKIRRTITILNLI